VIPGVSGVNLRDWNRAKYKYKKMNDKSLLYLWKERTLYLGRLDEPLHLLQGAATLCVSLEGLMSIRLPGSDHLIETRSVLLPPDCSVYIDTRGHLIANLNLDVMGSDYHYLSKRMGQRCTNVHLDLEYETDFRSKLSALHRGGFGSDEAKELLYHALRPDNHAEFSCDNRVQRVVQKIQSAIDHNLPIEQLASSVNLSTPRLVQLFKKQTGVPIRRYRQWHRLYVTASHIGKGKNLTEAAIAAGFVDLSHCTHTFHQMLGVRPSYFLQRPNEIRVITEGDYSPETAVSTA